MRFVTVYIYWNIIKLRLSQWRDLNSWPLPYQGNALPLSYIGNKRERETGFEPATFSLEGWRSTNWATPAFLCGESRIRTCEGKNQQIYSLSSLAAWVSPRIKYFKELSRWRDSNPRPADYKSAALASWATSAISAIANGFIYFFLKKNYGFYFSSFPWDD